VVSLFCLYWTTQRLYDAWLAQHLTYAGIFLGLMRMDWWFPYFVCIGQLNAFTMHGWRSI
jgi:hypothetical protein